MSPHTHVRSIALVALLALPACTERTSSRPPGSSDPIDAGIADARVPFVPPDAAPYDAGVCSDVVDVVLVLDVSSSMSFVLEDLEADIAQVVSAAETLAPEPHFGFIGFADNHAFATNGALEGGRVHTSASTLQTAFRDFLETYTDWNRNPGDGPSGRDTQNPICEENSLDAL